FRSPPLPQARQATVGHPHPRTLAALAARAHRHFDSAAVQGHRRTRRLGRHPPRGLPTLLTSLTPGCPTPARWLPCGPAKPSRSRSAPYPCPPAAFLVAITIPARSSPPHGIPRCCRAPATG